MQRQSPLKRLSKLLQRTILKKEERSDAPASHAPAENTPAAEVLPAKPPAIPKGPEADFPDTPLPSYEDACSGPNGASASVRAVAVAQRPENTRIRKVVDQAMAQVDHKLLYHKQMDSSLDSVYISSRIRQLCDFAACRIDEEYQLHPKANLTERRQKTQREIERLFNLVFTTVDWKRQSAIRVVGVATNAFNVTALQAVGEKEQLNYWHARAGAHLMVSLVCRTAALMLERLAARKDYARDFAKAADSNAKAARCNTDVALVDEMSIFKVLRLWLFDT
ncbi:hypothetical protein PG993_008103 [Apiospora rasikravindrae]|uniref:Uncharacterized protein n=1 Tax=Apiospora rasikravindrae TaxID=990691 RepID=A0ABR1SZD5_9PEZI